ncbi:hypothetical protein [Cronobacter dublinensis]|uniref:hypothetical protein n=1 Tax=Cronobacter dublinensis TaxID=413497 RepID=UPI001ED97A67|nr:hypothetical protein [Cronobacter dublinensis]
MKRVATARPFLFFSKAPVFLSLFFALSCPERMNLRPFSLRFIPDEKKQHPFVFLSDKITQDILSAFFGVQTYLQRLHNMVKQAKSGDLPAARFMLKNM